MQRERVLLTRYLVSFGTLLGASHARNNVPQRPLPDMIRQVAVAHPTADPTPHKHNERTNQGAGGVVDNIVHVKGAVCAGHQAPVAAQLAQFDEERQPETRQG